ncbi:MAG: hypothetical protein LBR48_04635 [Dysgonamonadaceae bacterium]|jgi:hypothetical protein|nr:hypothetical protein [Dysgonamonadaceae bacterium]
MSRQCPLCGKEKRESELFCSDCSRKIKNEYEIDVSVSPQENAVPVSLPAKLPENGTNAEFAAENPLMPPEKKNTGRKLKAAALVILICSTIAVSGFYVYKNIVLANNLERSDWDVAVKENTVDAYLSYIQKYPEGKHSDKALENLKTLKDSEAALWEQIRNTDNTSELQDFVRRYPQSAYNTLVRIRLDSLMWVAAVNTNTAQAYADYIVMSENAEFNGDYIINARQRFDMLRQDYPVNSEALNALRSTVDGFYIALSNVDYNRLNEYLAPVVSRFFGSGTASRETIIRKLLIAGAKTPAPTIKFTPDINALVYEKNVNGSFICNVPLSKRFVDTDSMAKDVSGYIAHIETDTAFAITQIYEDKPFVLAP